MNLSLQEINRSKRSIVWHLAFSVMAAFVFIFMAIIVWKGRSSIALIACSISLLSANYSIYKSANAVIEILESRQSEPRGSASQFPKPENELS